MASLVSLAIQLQGCHDARDAEEKSIKLLGSSVILPIFAAFFYESKTCIKRSKINAFEILNYV